ncbi:MAG: AAA family ATPase [Euryarchaeota archaeon]
MNSEELSRYVFAKLSEAKKLSQDNIKLDDILLDHRSTYFQIEKHVNEFLEGYTENRFVIMPGLRGIGKTTILFQIYNYLIQKKGIEADRILYISMDELSAYLGTGLLEAIDVFIEDVHNTSLVNLDQELFILVDEAHYDNKWSQSGKIVYDKSKKIFGFVETLFF